MLGAALSSALSAVLQFGSGGSSDSDSDSGSNSMRLLHVLTTTKAALRCLEVARASSLQLSCEDGADGAEAQEQRFAAALLSTCSAAGSNEGSSGGDSFNQQAAPYNTLQLLWQLVAGQAGSHAAAHKACGLLRWCLDCPSAHLQPVLSPPAAALVASRLPELLAQLEAAAAQPLSRTCRPSALCWVSCCACWVRCCARGAGQTGASA